MSNEEFQICPIFSNMFSDLSHYPRNQLVRRDHSSKVPVCSQFTTTHPPNITHKSRIDINGVDRYKYFHKPLKCENLKLKSTQESPAINEETIKIKKSCTKKIQTQYRESSAQTTPWEPSFVIKATTDPELLKIDFLKWGSGLPFGVHEIELIERARMKRAWQQHLEQNYSNDLQKCGEILGAIERDEWLFREKEIQDIQNQRLALLEDMLNEIQKKTVKRSEIKMKNFAEIKTIEINDKLRKLQKKTERELRKIQIKETGIDQLLPCRNQNKSLIKYQSQMRFCVKTNKKNNDRKLCPHEFRDIENINTLPEWLDQATKIKDCCCLKLPGRHLCIRETKWTGPVLKELHQELEHLRYKKEEKQFELSTVSIQSFESVLNTPEVEGIPDWEEERFQSVITLQSIIKGRAAQFLIYKGRHRCHQLIEELKYNHFLVDENKEIYDRKSEIKLQQRKERLEYEKLIKLKENLQKLQHNIVGTLLEFLNQKLHRLLEERRVHALCIMLDHKYSDKIIQSDLTIDEQSFDRCLENIISEGMKCETKEDVKDYVKSLLKQIESDVFRILKKKTSTNQDTEDNSFLQDIRDKNGNQLDNLKSIHEMIYK